MLKLDGKALATRLEALLPERVARLSAQGGPVPTLATILVGDDPASATYVRMKVNACRRAGMGSLEARLDRTASEAALLEQIETFNRDPAVHGILLQHPVPAHIEERRCFDAIRVEKDVDGVTSHGFGRMAMGEPAFGSATPRGIMHMLEHYGLEVAGRHAVVVGRSPILGKPMAMMLLNANATVTVCHSRTRDLERVVATADVIVGAVGKPELIRAHWIKDGAVVIDAGYHVRPGASPVGDVELGPAIERVRAYTPVPGGVGPMTIYTLLSQTVDAAERLAKQSG
jgi:methylenetetrahydrofolate dehydrogenase (NADP+)/methenyltetrahydrofolate cyclohydrolase